MFVIYLLVVAASIGIFILIDRYASQPQAGPGAFIAVTSGLAHPNINNLLHVLLALTAVLVTARVTGAIFTTVKQPAVIGEVLGGILLGPSLLGYLAPHVYSSLLPSAVAPFLEVIAQLGVIFYMFLVGLDLDLKVLKKSGHTALVISHSSIIIPFLLGSFLALAVRKEVCPPQIPFTNFALFLAISMSLTAFPVLARIMSDQKMNKTWLGTIALTCAAVDDVTAWCLLAVIISIAGAQQGGSATQTIILTFVYIAAMFVIVRPIMKRVVDWLDNLGPLTESVMAIFLVGLLLSSFATEIIGIHAIFGAFLLGAVISHESLVAKELTLRLEHLVRILLLPTFFAFTGMRTQIGLLSSREDWLLCGIIIAVATLGKFGGSLLPARMSGLNWREASAIGILMNTRGLVELIVLNLGLDLKIITPRLFAMLVLMALVTTVLTPPIFHWITWGHPWKEKGSEMIN
jgi:Kef-type K+ transport system membrane component KefB